jgi:hypothetical protein
VSGGWAGVADGGAASVSGGYLSEAHATASTVSGGNANAIAVGTNYGWKGGTYHSP